MKVAATQPHTLSAQHYTPGFVSLAAVLHAAIDIGDLDFE